MSSTTTQLQPLTPLLQRMLGRRQNPTTTWRWISLGVKAGDRRVKLRAVKVGGKLYATPDDVQRFIDEQNLPTVDDDDQPDRSPETERRLTDEGLL